MTNPMTAESSRGPYRIAVVAELTGVPEPTLRAWERRYEIPTPRRTSSGYRLYGEREVDQVRRMRALCESGISAAEAAKIVARERRSPAPRRDDDAFGSATKALLDAVSRFDELALEREARRLTFLGPAIPVIDGVIVPTLRTVGELWERGELSIAQEHLVAQRLGTVLRDFLRLAPGGERAVVVGCFADEQHELGALSIAVRLATWGFRPAFLGARTPADAIGRAVRAIAPAAVFLSANLAPERERARELVGAYAAAIGPVPWAVGGSGADDIADLVRAAGGRPFHETDGLEPWVRRTLGKKTAGARA